MNQEEARKPRQANPRKSVRAPSPPAGARVPERPPQAQSVLAPEIQASTDLSDLRDAYRAAQEENKSAQAEMKACDKRIRDLSDELVRLSKVDREAEQRRTEQAILRTKTLLRKRKDAVASLEAQLAWYGEETPRADAGQEEGPAGAEKEEQDTPTTLGEAAEAPAAPAAPTAPEGAPDAADPDPADPVAIEFEDPAEPATQSAPQSSPQPASAPANRAKLLKAAKAYLLAQEVDSYLSSHANKLEATLRTDAAYLEANLEEQRRELASRQAAARDLRRKRDLNIENIQALTDELAANGVSIAEMEEMFTEMSAENLRRRQLEIPKDSQTAGDAGKRIDIDRMLELVRSRVASSACEEASPAPEGLGDHPQQVEGGDGERSECDDQDGPEVGPEVGPEAGTEDGPTTSREPPSGIVEPDCFAVEGEPGSEPSEDVDARIVATLSRTGERLRLEAAASSAGPVENLTL